MDLVLSMGSLELDEDDLMLTVDMSEACKPSATHVLKGAQSGIVHGENQENPQRISTCRVQTSAVLRNSSICETGRRTGGISPAVSHRTGLQNLRDVAWSSEEVLASSEPTLLRQASAECTGVKTLLLRLRRLLQEEADANVTFSTLPNSDGSAAINQALLLGEISRLNERVREQDKIICKMQQQLDERGLQGTILGCDGRVERACQTDDATSSIYPFQAHRWPSSLERRGLGLAYMATSPSVALNDKQSRTNQRVNNSSPIVLPSPPTPPSSLCENANVHACDCKRLNRECSEMLTSVGSEKMFPRHGSPVNQDVPAVSLHGLAATPNDAILHRHESDSILHLKHIFECCSITNNDMGPLPASSPTIKRSTASCKRHSVEAITQGLKSNVEWNSSPHRPPLQCPCDLMSISDDMTVVIQV
uniref:Uncharacterized protein n=1 Tax=Eptatretus burgeri TaxID=7764 RepID=A0A8C4RB47_EPTBU